jgi:hypothetical protein
MDKDRIHYLFKDCAMSYKGSYSVCSNPLCTCCNIDFIFDRQNDQQLANDICVSLNVREKEISKDNVKVRDEQFSRKLVNDLNYEDWQFLTNLFLEKKTVYSEQADLMSLDIMFPIDEIEEEGLLVSFNGILPFAPVVTLDINGFVLKIEDLHCVYQQCTCKDVHLIISPFKTDNIILPFEEENTEEMNIVYNIKKNKWSLEEQKGLQVNPNDVISQLSKQIDIHSFYSERHRLIRNLYKNCIRKTLQLPTVMSISIGRNDPCPCGSGKKYKKCCWGKEI